MRFPPEPPTFTRRETVIGVFKAGDTKTPGLDCVIDISLAGAHAVMGWILGNTETAQKIDAVFEPGRALRFEGDNGTLKFSCEDVSILQTTQYGAPTPEIPAGLVGVVCQFQSSDISLHIDLAGRDSRSDPNGRREIRFLLTGPRERWQWWGIRERSHTGQASAAPERRVALGRRLPFSMFVVPFFLDDRNGLSDRNESVFETSALLPRVERRETSVMSLVCRTRQLLPAYADETFLEEATAAVNDLCLLVSLISRATVSWSAHVQSTSRRAHQYVRSQ